MKHFDGLASGEITPALVGFTDITDFGEITRGKDLAHTYGLLSQMSDIADQVIAPSSGQIIKYIGDAILVAFPADDADQGVRVLLTLQQRVAQMFEERGLANRLTVGIDVGDVVVGRMKPIDLPDVFGQTVNNAVSIDRRQHRGRFIISPTAFRRLEPETRKLFHRHTPPIVYLAG